MASPDSKSRLAGLVEQAVRTAFPSAPATVVELERPKSREHGDFATNVALQLAKHVGQKPRDVASAIVAALPRNDALERCEIAGPGFINFTLAAESRFAVVGAILAAGPAFGKSNERAGHRIMVEFVSANPTGPLHVGHGRQAALGDAISTLLEWQGWRVTREFYYNDAGNQIANLGLSVQARIRQAHGFRGHLGGARVREPQVVSPLLVETLELLGAIAHLERAAGGRAGFSAQAEISSLRCGTGGPRHPDSGGS